MRRLVETLIIDAYESAKCEDDLKDGQGEYQYLSGLINVVARENRLNLTRNSKKSLGKLKDIGDLAAHSRHYISKRSDLDRVSQDFRIVIEELIVVARKNREQGIHTEAEG